MASTLDDISAIRTRFLSVWDDTIPVVFANEPNAEEPTSIWARLSFGPIQRSAMSIASRTYENYGRLYLQVMVPAGQSDHDGWTVAQSFADAFEDWHSTDYRIRFSSPAFTPSDDEDDYYVILVSIPFTAKH